MPTTSPEVYLVGGAVRDLLLGRTSKDKDYMVDCSYDELRKFVLDRGHEILVENPEFLTLRVRSPLKQVLDFACCRADMEYDGRRPGAVKRTHAQDDLARRDFTMNAMAMLVDPDTLVPTGTLLDPFKGADDIQFRIIRFVGSPQERLAEDGLRWLRALRFSITLDFHLSRRTEQALKRAGPSTMDLVHLDRIREELQKCFGYNTGASLKLLNEYPLLWLKAGLWLKPTTETAKLR